MRTFTIPMHVLAVMLLVAAASFAGEARQPAKPKTRKHISAWFGYQKGKTATDEIAPLADIIDSLSICGDEPPAEFVAAVRAKGIETYRMVWCDKDSAFNTPEKRDATIKDHVRLCMEIGFDGIDLDYESVPPESKQLYSDFMQKLSEQLRPLGKKMTHAVFTFVGPPEQSKTFYNLDVINATCDRVKVMCYDVHAAPALYAGWWTFPRQPGFGPVSTQPWARANMEYWQTLVPKEKLIMALPAYGNDYDAAPGGKGQQIYEPVPPIPDGTKFDRFWLSYEQVHVYRYVDKANRPRIFFASDTDSTKAHLKTIDELGVPGLSFWHFQAVPPETWQAVREWLASKEGG